MVTNCLPIMAQLLMAIHRNNDTSELCKHFELANNIFHPETGQSLTYRKLIKHPKYKAVWTTSAANEFGRLTQGIGNCIHRMDTIKFVTKSSISLNRWKDMTYMKFVCEY